MQPSPGTVKAPSRNACRKLKFLDIDFFKTRSLINLFTNAPPPIAIMHSFLLRHFNTSFSSSDLKKFSPFF